MSGYEHPASPGKAAIAALDRWMLEHHSPALPGTNRSLVGYFRLLQCNGDEAKMQKAYENRKRLGGW